MFRTDVVMQFKTELKQEVGQFIQRFKLKVEADDSVFSYFGDSLDTCVDVKDAMMLAYTKTFSDYRFIDPFNGQLNDAGMALRELIAKNMQQLDALNQSSPRQKIDIKRFSLFAGIFGGAKSGSAQLPEHRVEASAAVSLQ